MINLDAWEADAKAMKKELEAPGIFAPNCDRILTLIDLVRKKDAGIKALFDLMDAGFLVRDISNDHKSEWAAQALAVTLEVKKAHEALALTRELK